MKKLNGLLVQGFILHECEKKSCSPETVKSRLRSTYKRALTVRFLLHIIWVSAVISISISPWVHKYSLWEIPFVIGLLLLCAFIDSIEDGELDGETKQKETVYWRFIRYQKGLERALGRSISPVDEDLNSDITTKLFMLAERVKSSESAYKKSLALTPAEKMEQRLQLAVYKNQFANLHEASSKFCLSEPKGYYFQDMPKPKELAS